ncbi:TBC1 domain family member 20 isoform X2 [Maylandia zebra]|uniref:TBC1 domain family member 20 n=2 Tax=Haplochromini TaxID=319058 RepID=A0A3B4FQW5_9CICH|nr:TBC1 domain family member 20 [Maylandia zebra]XP_005740655.1 PREDICTED: TBC1 domain family member 20-like [Pundamilia nyererei]XP_026011608.1 TBC1 domain family member 20-like isoform X2 [Astatotilapia calliptera]XP_039876585.1 TBC1 domain family member 20 [Simochromis diagramma]XP_039876586.1 TBC1 domain family member 20 [Simochromis diagramma]
MKRLKRKKQNGGVVVNGNGSFTREPGCGRKQKLAEIHQALISDPVDIETLRRAAVSKGGLLTDELRRKVWPKLLNINVYELPHKPGRDVRENHKDYNQVVLDVRRSMKRFPKGMPATERAVLQEQLIDIILEVLKRNTQLHYYQGYHDVAVTLLLVVGERMAIALLDTLSNYHLRDFMDPTMDSTKHILNYLMPILEQVDLELHDFMIRAEVGTIFALSWLITWYGHVLSEFKHTLRLYDFFLASHPLMPIYLAATIVLHREKEVKQTECDMAMVHHLLSRIPQDLPYELLIGQAQDLFEKYPPSLLAKRAALQSRKSRSISTFQAFQLSTLHQRPDSVLQRLTKAQGSTTSRHGLEAALPGDRGQLWRRGNRMVKMAVWGLSATLGAAVFAVAQTAMDWGPEALLQLF